MIISTKNDSLPLSKTN